MVTMAGAYCKFCGHRCFVLRKIPDGPQAGWTGHLATCAEGMAHDLKVTGHTHLTAINPVTAADVELIHELERDPEVKAAHDAIREALS